MKYKSFSRFWMLMLLVGFYSCHTDGQNTGKINGLSFVASSKKISHEEVEVMVKTNANYAAIMPFAFLQNLNSTAIFFDNPRQWWGEKAEGCAETIRMCHEKGIKVKVKPQIWVGSGEFTGLIEMKTEDDWFKFEENYSKFILTFAKIAQEQHAEMFCIGTELERFVKHEPVYWSRLIEEIRAVYSGKITYAENWDCFDQPSFLRELDFVGVDAYFPLADEKSPSVEQIRAGWQKHLAVMELCYKTTGKQILFTECGYRSVDYAGAKPWDYNGGNKAVNEELQARLTEVLFELWQQEWMAGGFIWKWFPFHDKAGGSTDNQFSPQNKLAQKTITEFFGKSR
jgi:hypothetical protein